MTSMLKAVLAAALAGALLAGCGVKGPLEPAPGAVSQGDTAPAPAAKKAHDPFILDGLL